MFDEYAETEIIYRKNKTYNGVKQSLIEIFHTITKDFHTVTELSLRCGSLRCGRYNIFQLFVARRCHLIKRKINRDEPSRKTLKISHFCTNKFSHFAVKFVTVWNTNKKTPYRDETHLYIT